MALHSYFLLLIIATHVGLALAAGAAPVSDDPIQRAEDLSNLAKELLSATDAANTAASAASSRPLEGDSDNVEQQTRRESQETGTIRAQLSGQGTGVTSGGVDRLQNGSYRAYRTEEDLPSAGTASPVDMPNSRYPRAQDQPNSGGTRSPSAYYPRGSRYPANPSSAGASRSSAGSSAPYHTVPTTVVSNSTPPGSYSGRASTSYGRSTPTDIRDSAAPLRESDPASFVRNRRESLQQIRDSLERLAEVIQLIMLKVTDEQQAYLEACGTGNCSVLG